MSKGNVFENDYMKLVFQNAAIANIGDAGGLQPSASAGNLYVALHTTSPGEAGDQTTNEIAYTTYARIGVVRSSGGWTVSNNQASNAAAVTFALCAAGSATPFFVSVGTVVSRLEILYYGPLGTNQGPFTAKTDDTITIPGHTFSVDDRVAFFANETDANAIPTGLTEGTVYWVKTVSGQDITVSTTQGGGAVDITAVGDGFAYKMVSLAISAGITPSFGIGTLVFTEG